MKSMVVLFALCAVAYGYGTLGLAHLPGLVLDPHGRPLDTPEVINNRALHLQAKALEGHYGYGANLIGAYGYGNSWLGNGLGLGGHYLHKRSLGHLVHAAPAAVSHQSRVDVISTPAVVSHAVAAPVLAHGALPLANHGVIAGHHGVFGAHGLLTPINHAAVAPIGVGAIW